jgi:hypothetical protein
MSESIAPPGYSAPQAPTAVSTAGPTAPSSSASQAFAAPSAPPVARIGFNLAVIGVVVAIFAAGAIYVTSNDPFAGLPTGLHSETGLQARNAVVAGCEATAGSDNGSYCRCVFAEVVSVAPYNTVAGLESLDGPADRFISSHDARDIPQVIVAAATACHYKLSPSTLAPAA